MSQRRKSTQAIALFPFLAVLVCTMGSLIFLLLVTTTMISDQGPDDGSGTGQGSPLLALSVSKPERPIAPPLATTVSLEPEVPAESTESKLEVRAIAMAKRQQELNALTAQWQGRVDDLNATRDERARFLAQRQQLHQGAAKRVGTTKLQLHDMEVKLGKMTGELSVPSGNGDGTEKERKELEAQVKELRQRLRSTQESSNDDVFEVVPFDVITGTSRRPILIECTSKGLRFIPEEIEIKPDDLVGFTPQVNPLIVGTSALVNYWTAWNLRQQNPSREPEPYVLLLVRPSGTISYYVAMRMLSDLKQAHGYELIEEDTVLQMPPVDAGSKAACEAAVKRLLSERDQVLRQAGNGGGGYGTGRGRPGGGYGNGSGGGRGGPGGSGGGAYGGGNGLADGGPGGTGPGGSGPAGGSAGGGGTGGSGRSGEGGSGSEESGGGHEEFVLSDILGGENQSEGDWNRVENFEGARRGSNGSGGPGRAGSAAGRAGGGPGGSTPGRPGARVVDGTGSGTGTGSGSGSGTSGRMVTASAVGNSARGAGKPGTVPNSAGGGEDSGIEDLSGEDGPGGEGGGQGTDPRGGRGSGPNVDIGLGSSGKRSIPVEDHRSGRKRKPSDGDVPTDPEHMAGRHWGISEPGAAIGLERDVRVDVEKNRYVIGKKHGVPLVDTDSREDTFVKMVTVMDLQARDWGKPPQGFFWKPSLRFVIADGADANYERVQSLFERAGISNTREYLHDHPTEATAPAAKPAAPPTYTPAPAAPKPSRRLFPGIMR